MIYKYKKYWYNSIKRLVIMHINNVNEKTSLQTIVALSILCFIVTAIFVSIYSFSGVETYSISGFFEWAVTSFKAVCTGDVEDKVLMWILFVILPVGLYLCLFWAIISRNVALREFNSKLNLKSVDLLQDRINFNFNKSQYNFACGYSEVNNLEMVLKTILVHTKYGTNIVLKQITLDFTVLNNKKFSLSNTPVAPMGLIYKILEYSRYMNNFSYKFEGAGVAEDYREKIENYLSQGGKTFIASCKENNMKWASILFFIAGLIMLFASKDFAIITFQDGYGYWIILMPFMLVIVSFIFDIILIINSINKNKFRGYNG